MKKLNLSLLIMIFAVSVCILASADDFDFSGGWMSFYETESSESIIKLFYIYPDDSVFYLVQQIDGGKVVQEDAKTLICRHEDERGFSLEDEQGVSYGFFGYLNKTRLLERNGPFYFPFLYCSYYTYHPELNPEGQGD